MKPSNTHKFGNSGELLDLYDDFVEFHDHCSFLCDAIASMVAEDDRFDTCTAMGIKRFCHWVKDRGQNLKNELKCIQEKQSKNPSIASH
jgi:gamma-glutamylcysteine synthetase